MRSLGGLLFFLGAGSIVLHLLGREFLVLAPLTPYQPWAGAAVAVIGAVLIFLGERSDRRVEAETVSETRADSSDVVGQRATVERETAPPPDRDLSSPVGYGPPSEAGSAPGTAITAAPGEATQETTLRREPRERDPNAPA